RPPWHPRSWRRPSRLPERWRHDQQARGASGPQRDRASPPAARGAEGPRPAGPRIPRGGGEHALVPRHDQEGPASGRSRGEEVMTEILSRLAPPAGAHHSEKRLGRGTGSGLGKTCGRGQKGQKARNGGNIGKLHFQGGQTPLQRRLPKRGFRVPFPVQVVAVNVGDLERFDNGATLDEQALRAARLVQGRGVRIKILGGGELTKKLTVSAHSFSKSAQAKIEKAGGQVNVLAPVEPAQA